MDLFLIHCLILAWMTLGTAKKLAASVSERLLVAAVLAWGNVVATALVLAALNRLGNPVWFLSISALLAAMVGIVIVYVLRRTPLVVPPSRTSLPNPWLLAAFCLTLLPLLYGNFLTAWNYPPNSPEALAVHLPRTLYYLGQGNLVHFSTADPRQVGLPFNYSLLQAFVSVYATPPQSLNGLNLGAWVLAGIGVYRLCRLCHCGPNAALLTAWLVYTAIPLLAQIATGNPELPAAVALLTSLVFWLSWSQTHQIRFIFLAALAAGLGLGGSLSVLLCAPALTAVLILRRRAFTPAESLRTGTKTVATSLLLIMAGSFAAINLLETGSLLGGAVLSLPDADTGKFASFGITGILAMLSLFFYLGHFSRCPSPLKFAVMTGLSCLFSGFALLLFFHAGPREFLPAFLLLSPCIAACFESGLASRDLRILRMGVISLALLAAGWSAKNHLLQNSNRPLSPLLTGDFVPSALPPLPLLLADRLSRPDFINVDSDCANERIYPMLVQGRGQRITSGSQVNPAAYHLVSRSALARNSGLRDLDKGSVYLIIDVPSKRTAGVEYLATIGNGARARDYFGLRSHADREPASTQDRKVLVTLTRAGRGSDAILIRTTGLNPSDQARLVVNRIDGDETSHVVDFVSTDEPVISLTTSFSRLDFVLMDSASGNELGRSQVFYLPKPGAEPVPVDPGLPSSPYSLFSTDVVTAGDSGSVTSRGLSPTEGPLPQWDLPYIRGAPQPVVRLQITPPEPTARLHVRFSLRLHQREAAEFEVVFNGQLLGRHRLEADSPWLDQTLELSPQPGVNFLEFRDAPLLHEPNWKAYLDRYQDVRRYLISSNIPLEKGAREHYENHGRAEGRTVRTRALPPPPSGSYYYIFRHLQVEGFSDP
jgi:hypothetical protein